MPNPLSLTLPWPPSVNSYWRHARGRTYISAEGRCFREAVTDLYGCRAGHFPEGEVSVRMWLFPPDRRRRDVDNVGKATLDALEHAGVFANDNQVADLHITRMPPAKGAGRVEAKVAAWPGEGGAP